MQGNGINSHILRPLWQRAQHEDDAPLLHWCDLRGRVRKTLTAGDIAAACTAFAENLRDRGLRPGDRVLLAYPPSLDFAIAFAGCLWAGVLPVPTYPPQPGVEPEERRLEALADAADCKLALTTRNFRRLSRFGEIGRILRGGERRRKSLDWWIPESFSLAKKSAPPHHVASEDDAFLQFTSGSTSHPKGVRITHGNLTHQLAFNREVLGLDRTSRAVLWVPQYHDLGLISGLLSALVGNGEAWFLSPLSFLRDPGVWFDVIHEVRGTHTAAPNFAFDFLLDRTTAQRRAAWDLSCLEVVMSAGEPVRPASAQRFFREMSSVHLHPNAFCPAYGLAEHTVGVTLRGRRSLRIDGPACENQRKAVVVDQGGIEVQGCGKPGPDIRLRIVAPETLRSLEEGEIGEIWVDSPSKAAGYWALPEQSEKTFAAHLPQEHGTWLRTGDLGFLHEGELFVTGRLKDLIIINGRNIAPEDLEHAVRKDPRVRPGGIAAFPLHGAAGECVGVLAEARKKSQDPSKLGECAREILEEVQACWPVPTTLFLVPPKSVPKTTSGKVRRAAARTALLDGEIHVLARLASGTGIQEKRHA